MNTVLFVASTYSHIVHFHLPYLQAFRELGWQVHVGCGGAPADIPEADAVFSLPFEKRMSSPENFRAQAELRRRMRENRYALVCTHTSLASFFARRAAAGLTDRPPLVTVAHGYLFGEQTGRLKNRVLLAAEKWTAPQTDLLLTMNEWDYRAAVRNRLGRRVENIPGIGVDFSRFDRPSDGAALRLQLGLTPSDFLLIYAAEFSARKNQALLIRALADLPERVRLLLPGQGALLEECRALARELGLESRVFFPGQLTDMPRWYRACDAAVSASRSEGLPFNVMEAMYCRLPVVASAVKGHTDLLRDGGTGLLYPCGDGPAFVRKVRELMDSPALAEQLRDAAFRAVQPYRLDAVLPVVMDAYLSVLPESLRRESAALPL